MPVDRTASINAEVTYAVREDRLGLSGQSQVGAPSLEAGVLIINRGRVAASAEQSKTNHRNGWDENQSQQTCSCAHPNPLMHEHCPSAMPPIALGGNCQSQHPNCGGMIRVQPQPGHLGCR